MLVFLGMIMDDWKCAKGIPWTAHEPNARADTLIYMVFSDYVCEHKMVMVESNSFFGASELGPMKYEPIQNRDFKQDVDDKAEKTRSPFEGGCKCNETEAPKRYSKR
jgi:hypothetical protein